MSSLKQQERQLQDTIEFLRKDVIASHKALTALESIFQREGKHTAKQEHQFEEYTELYESGLKELEEAREKLFHLIKNNAPHLN
jgi:predicted  nucleic acid-binding Zn-ribbon protein